MHSAASKAYKRLTRRRREAAAALHRVQCRIHSEVGKAAFLTASSCKTLASMKTNATAVVWASFGSLMVQRDRYDTYWGAKKIIFFVREIDDAAMAAASMETYRFVARRSPWGRLWSVRYTCNRLRRMRGRFHRWIHMRTGAQLPTYLYHELPKISIQSSLESPKRWRMRRRRLPDLRPIP